MGCSSVGAAVRGERDVGFATERGAGDAMLDRIAKASKAVQERKAKMDLKRDRGSWKCQNAFAATEKEAPEADWWNGDGGKTVAAPRDETPFQDTGEYEEDYDYDYEAWDEFEMEDYDVEEDRDGGNRRYDDDGGGPVVQLPDYPDDAYGGASKPASNARKAPSARNTNSHAASNARADSSDDEGSSRPKNSRAKSKAKAAPKSNDPWGDSSEEDSAPPPKAKGKGKGKTPSNRPADDSDSEGERRRQEAAIKIQAAQRGRAARGAPKAKPKSRPAAKASPNQRAGKDGAPWGDSDSSGGDAGYGQGSNSLQPARRPKAKAKRRPASEAKAPLLGNKKRSTSEDSEMTSMNSSKTAPAGSPGGSRPKARPKTKSRGKPGPRSGEGNQPSKPAALDDSSSEDDGKVMF